MARIENAAAPAAPKNKGGRPPKYAGEGKRITHTMRFREKTRLNLIKAAERSGRSMSEEIEHRVERSFEAPDSVKVGHLMQVAAVAGMLAELQTGKSADDDLETFELAIRT